MTELVGIVCHSRFLQSIQKCHNPAAIRIDYYESQLWLIYCIADGHSLWFHWEKQFVTKNSNAAFTVFYFQRHWEDKWPYGTECGFVKPFTESLFFVCWKWRNGGCWFLVLKFLCINKFQLVQLDKIFGPLPYTDMPCLGLQLKKFMKLPMKIEMYHSSHNNIWSF